jgi:hypothetical protein
MTLPVTRLARSEHKKPTIPAPSSGLVEEHVAAGIRLLDLGVTYPVSVTGGCTMR